LHLFCSNIVVINRKHDDSSLFSGKKYPLDILTSSEVNGPRIHSQLTMQNQRKPSVQRSLWKMEWESCYSKNLLSS